MIALTIDDHPRRRPTPLALRYSHAYREPRPKRAAIAIEAMSEDHDPIAIREVSLAELAPGSALHAPFRQLHRAWTSRGVERWLDLVDPRAPHPVVVFGAFTDHGRVLVGAVVGVWGRDPVDRFDDLLVVRPSVGIATSRPTGGAWHLIGVTTDDRQGGLGLGRALLGRVLAWAADQGHDVVRTLSPALGLPELMATWPTSDRVDAVARAARVDGKPVLQVLRLHLGGGAVLERVLPDSRMDDHASDRVTLRFRYATDPDTRRARRERWQLWCRERAEAIARGDATSVAADCHRVTSALDASIVCEAH